MHFIRCPWLRHAADDKSSSPALSIYSVHVHPDGSRLATGGLDGKVRIWDTNSIYEAVNTDSDEPKQLCAMSNHNGAVTCVRFSGSGRYLASGSDDKIVLIWEIDTENPGQVFGSTETHIENWRNVRRLAGHDNDVQDLAWSPDSAVLVSVGLDSNIFVWSGTTFDRLSRLSTHQSHIKGVSFDPAGRYFCTASDDRTMKIFSTDSLSVLKSVTLPFAGSPLTTYYRRCSWSPDGAHISAPNATNGPVPTVAIINRITWDCQISLVGHELPTEVALFNPRMWRKDPNTSKGWVTVIACVGQDRALSIWNTSNPRPLVIAQNIATKPINDLAWSPDGMALFGCSMDGSILACVFEESDLGYTVPIGENRKVLEKFGYGRPMKIAEGIPVPTSILDRTKRTGQVASLQTRKPVETKPFTQIVTITKDGRKRVAPQLISAPKISSTASIATRTDTEVNLAPTLARPMHRPSQLLTYNNSTNKRKASQPLEPVTKRIRPSLPMKMRESRITDDTNVKRIKQHVPQEAKNIITAKIDEVKGLTVRNSDRGSTITLSHSNNLVWTDILARPATLVAGNARFSSVACDDNAVFIYSDVGRRLIPPLILESPPFVLETYNERHLLVITKNLRCHVWDVFEKESLFPSLSIEQLLVNAKRALNDDDAVFMKTGIRSNGQLVISFNSGEAYTYSSMMATWCRIYESAWARTDEWKILGAGPMRSIEVQTKPSKIATNGESSTRIEVLPLQYLETRIQSTKLLASTEEYQETVELYIKTLLEHNDGDKVLDWLGEMVRDTSPEGSAFFAETLQNLELPDEIASQVAIYARMTHRS